ncbi:Uncharacterised protein [Enterobacter hormaechei]|nr:Uncharacterised protein [Enterobacter hormaechei]SAE61347.1 Uncharacterised protein [Enterobacter hormaechei]
MHRARAGSIASPYHPESAFVFHTAYISLSCLAYRSDRFVFLIQNVCT